MISATRLAAKAGAISPIEDASRQQASNVLSDSQFFIGNPHPQRSSHSRLMLGLGSIPIATTSGTADICLSHYSGREFRPELGNPFTSAEPSREIETSNISSDWLCDVHTTGGIQRYPAAAYCRLR